MTQHRVTRHRSVEPADTSHGRDAGIGLIEIVISMFLISLLAIAFIPVIVSALRASELNSTAATATRLVSQAIDDARSRGAADCAAAQLLNATTAEVDAQGVTITVTTSVPAVTNCVAGSAITVTVNAVSSVDGSVLADARTLIYLTGTP
jgi:type II secretory pathway pseudopilin PulG